ncbi:MAG: flagellar hook-basal body complex protein FliE [Oscillospiraceae bacterium]|nr:flagellar hook-basal body complex protein FliE [Oscillospiraceae bacterium]
MSLNLNPLSSSLINLLDAEAARTRTPAVSAIGETPGGNFSDVLTESFKTASVTDTLDKISGLELLSGQTDDMSGLLLDATKAEISLNLALQIRNKIIDAYNEIMRMQV